MEVTMCKSCNKETEVICDGSEAICKRCGAVLYTYDDIDIVVSSKDNIRYDGYTTLTTLTDHNGNSDNIGMAKRLYRQNIKLVDLRMMLVKSDITNALDKLGIPHVYVNEVIQAYKMIKEKLTKRPESVREAAATYLVVTNHNINRSIEQICSVYNADRKPVWKIIVQLRLKFNLDIKNTTSYNAEAELSRVFNTLNITNPTIYANIINLYNSIKNKAGGVSRRGLLAALVYMEYMKKGLLFNECRKKKVALTRSVLAECFNVTMVTMRTIQQQLEKQKL